MLLITFLHLLNFAVAQQFQYVKQKEGNIVIEKFASPRDSVWFSPQYTNKADGKYFRVRQNANQYQLVLTHTRRLTHVIDSDTTVVSFSDDGIMVRNQLYTATPSEQGKIWTYSKAGQVILIFEIYKIRKDKGVDFKIMDHEDPNIDLLELIALYNAKGSFSSLGTVATVISLGMAIMR